MMLQAVAIREGIALHEQRPWRKQRGGMHMAHCTKTADAEDETAAPAGSAERDTLTLDYLVTII